MRLSLSHPPRNRFNEAYRKLMLAWGLRGLQPTALTQAVREQKPALRAGSMPSVLPQDSPLELGIGEVLLFRGGVALDLTAAKRFKTVADVTRLTALAADEHWQLCLHTPTSTQTFTRTSTGAWVLARYGRGFA